MSSNLNLYLIFVGLLNFTSKRMCIKFIEIVSAEQLLYRSLTLGGS